jgi:hypothetical protein
MSYQEGPYYVYGWYLNGELLYVGKGCGKRAWRNHELSMKILLHLPTFEVRILERFERESEALEIETALIAAYKPRYNVIGKQRIVSPEVHKRANVLLNKHCIEEPEIVLDSIELATWRPDPGRPARAGRSDMSALIFGTNL